MTDCHARLATLRRPRLLLQAARFGLADYRPERDLRRIGGLPSGALPPGAALAALIAAEEALETIRKTGDAAYSITRHLEVLIALLAEARRSGAPA